MSSAPPTSSCPDAARDALALSLAPRVGHNTWHAHVARFSSATHALDDAELALDAGALRTRANELIAHAGRVRARLIAFDGPGYPTQLLDLDPPPPVLWALGDLSLVARPGVAMVGTRGATSYGIRATRDLARAVASCGGAVVSGMALGIDAAAHEAALDANGATIAVLGTGIDVPYPHAHRALYERIRESGLLLSECLPGMRARPGSFPSRNRIIAALANVTVVVQAGVKSGALITAADALELGRTIAAVPGPIDSPQCEGSNTLLRDGAHVIAGPADLLSLAGLQRAASDAPPISDPHERAVWDALGLGPARVDELCERTGLPATTCFVAVTGLELRGALVATMTGELRRVTA